MAKELLLWFQNEKNNRCGVCVWCAVFIWPGRKEEHVALAESCSHYGRSHTACARRNLGRCLHRHLLLVTTNLYVPVMRIERNMIALHKVSQLAVYGATVQLIAESVPQHLPAKIVLLAVLQ